MEEAFGKWDVFLAQPGLLLPVPPGTGLGTKHVFTNGDRALDCKRISSRVSPERCIEVWNCRPVDLGATSSFTSQSQIAQGGSAAGDSSAFFQIPGAFRHKVERFVSLSGFTARFPVVITQGGIVGLCGNATGAGMSAK
jgi:hypothetical protein